MSEPEVPPAPRSPPPDVLRWDQIPSTRWTLVGRAGRADPAQSTAAEQRGALEELVRLYLPVLRGHLTTTLRIRPDRADDLLQGFLADRVVERNLIGQADATRGRFRRFLLTALNRYVTDCHRRESAGKRQPAAGPAVSIEAIAEQQAATPTAAAHFDRMWANEVLAEVMRRTRAECKAAGRLDMWAVFEARILHPVTAGVAPTPHAELARRLSLTDAAHSAGLVAAAKKLFTTLFRQTVSEYVRPQSDASADRQDLEREIDSEIRELWMLFARRG